jgi:hypothetical protein
MSKLSHYQGCLVYEKHITVVIGKLFHIPRLFKPDHTHYPLELSPLSSHLLCFEFYEEVNINHEWVNNIKYIPTTRTYTSLPTIKDGITKYIHVNTIGISLMKRSVGSYSVN